MQGMQDLERLYAGNHFYAVTRITMKETRATTMTAPMSEGMTAMPPSCGPQLPKSACPSADPARPAMMLAIQPIDPLRFVMAPAMAPMIAPTISVQIQYMMFPYVLVFKVREETLNYPSLYGTAR